jgi:hypothetical protein
VRDDNWTRNLGSIDLGKRPEFDKTPSNEKSFISALIKIVPSRVDEGIALPPHDGIALPPTMPGGAPGPESKGVSA